MSDLGTGEALYMHIYFNSNLKNTVEFWSILRSVGEARKKHGILCRRVPVETLFEFFTISLFLQTNQNKSTVFLRGELTAPYFPLLTVF